MTTTNRAARSVLRRPAEQHLIAHAHKEIRMATQFDPTRVAQDLRTLNNLGDGARYLHTLRLDRDQLVAVANALQITRIPTRMSTTKLTERVLHQAITVRRKFEGLRHW